MKYFTDYKDLIKQTVQEINTLDKEYTWKYHHLSKCRVQISWSYLNQNESQFSINFSHSDDLDEDEQFLTSRTPMDTMINGHYCTEGTTKYWQESYEHAIVAAIHECYKYAHKYY